MIVQDQAPEPLALLDLYRAAVKDLMIAALDNDLTFSSLARQKMLRHGQGEAYYALRHVLAKHLGTFGFIEPEWFATQQTVLEIEYANREASEILLEKLKETENVRPLFTQIGEDGRLGP